MELRAVCFESAVGWHRCELRAFVTMCCILFMVSTTLIWILASLDKAHSISGGPVSLAFPMAQRVNTLHVHTLLTENTYFRT